MEFESVTLRNFLSYGDYDTEVKLNNLGPTLITGEIVDDIESCNSDGASYKSNGAGKSTVPNAILWCLFGKTMHSSSPAGNDIINWFTRKPAVVTVKFTNNNIITRTRDVSGKTNIFFSKDGKEENFASETISTTAIAQAKLQREFDLDYDIFCGSCFLNQYGKPWLEMKDDVRKAAIERLLHLDRFTLYGEKAKTKVQAISSKLEATRFKINQENNLIKSLESENEKASKRRDNFAIELEQKRKNLIEKSREYLEKSEQITVPNIEKLSNTWSIISKVKSHIQNIENSVNELDRKISRQTDIRQENLRTIRIWEAKKGKVCVECEQEVPESHTASKIQPFIDRSSQAENEIKNLQNERKALKEKLETIKTQLAQKTPSMTLEQAESLLERKQQFSDLAARYENEANQVIDESNPFLDVIDSNTSRIEEAKLRIEELENSINQFNVLSNHYLYLQKGYIDRKKLKKLMLAKHIPYLNDKIAYYLDLFELDIKLSISESLGITSNMWSYQFESGGERRRTDIAIMLAIFDLHLEMYGPRSNVIVLDEPDSRMDSDGVIALLNIVNNDLSSRSSTVLVISHKGIARDAFPNNIHIKRMGRFSSIC